MKRLLQIGALFLLGMMVGAASAQSTSVTATITDHPDGQTWNNGTVTATFIPGPVQSFVWPGGAIPNQVSAVMNGSGTFTMSLPDNSTITPIGSTWNFSICPNASTHCVSAQIAVTGGSEDLSSQLSAVAASPRFPAGSSSYGYLDVEIFPIPLQGGVYWNVTNLVQRIWTGTEWVNQGGGGPSTCPGTLCVLLNPSLSQNIVQPPGTGFGITDNQDAPTVLSISNNDPGSTSATGVELTNGTDVALFALYGTGYSVPGGAIFQLSTPGAPFGIVTNNSPIFFQGSSTTSLEGVNTATDTGTLNAYVAYVAECASNPVYGTSDTFVAANSSTGPSTFSWCSGDTPTALVKNGSTALASGDILAGAVYTVVFDGTNWQLLNSSLTAGGGTGCGSGSNCVITNPSAGQVITQPASTQLGVNIENGSYYAAQFGASTGIASAIAQACTGLGCDVVAGADYANTESLPANIAQAGGFGTGNYLAMPNWPGLTRVRDERGGFDSQIFVAPTGSGSYYPATNTAKFPYGLYFNSAYDVTIPGNSAQLQSSVNQSFWNGPGNQIAGFGGVGIKSYDFGPVTNFTASDQGQHIAEQLNLSVGGIGDVVGDDYTINCAGGESTVNDEGCHGGDHLISEDQHVYKGTIASVTSSTVMMDTPTSGTGTQGDGRYRIDMTQIVDSGTFSGGKYATGHVSHLGQSPGLTTFTGTSFATGWVAMVCDPSVDTCNNGLDPTGKIDSVAGGYAPGLTTLDIVTSAPSKRAGYATDTTAIASSGIACVADSAYFETTTYTTLSSSQIQINLRKPHHDGMTVGVGGQCQTGLEITGSTYTAGSTNFSQIFPVVGNYNGTQLITWDVDSQQGYSDAVIGYNSNSYCSTDSNPTTFSASGTTVTVFETFPNVPDSHFAGQTAIVNTGNSTYNGTVTINYVSALHGGLYQRAYQYSISPAPSGSAPTSGTIQFCNTGYNLYPATEILSVLDPANNTVDGYHVLAPNNLITWTPGDTVEDPHYFWESVTNSGGLTQINQFQPRPPYNQWLTNGFNYQDLLSGGYVGFDIRNNTAGTELQSYGGAAPAPQTAYMAQGIWGNEFEVVNPPAINPSGINAVIAVDNCQPAPYGCSDPLNSPFAIYAGPSGGTDFIYDNTPAAAFLFGSAIQIGTLGFPTSLYAPVFGTLAVSDDLGSSRTPDGTFEGKFFQFYGTTPPTHYLNLELYGDSSTSIGMQFPSADGGVHSTFQGGTLSTGGYQLYVPNTTTAVKTAGISPTSTAGQVSCDDATAGDAGCTLLVKNLTASTQVSSPTVITTGSTPTVTLGTSGPTWTTGTSDPSGICKTGSIYSNSAGGSGHVFWTCVGSAWVDVK